MRKWISLPRVEGTASRQAHADESRGFGCIVERRAVETADGGTPTTPFLRPGDRFAIETRGRAGHTVFGAIEPEVVGHAATGRV